MKLKKYKLLKSETKQAAYRLTRADLYNRHQTTQSLYFSIRIMEKNII